MISRHPIPAKMQGFLYKWYSGMSAYPKTAISDLVILAELPFGKLRISAATFTENPLPLFGTNRRHLTIHDSPPSDGFLCY